MRRFEITLSGLLEDRNVGYCVECREEAYGVEPDAREYVCEACGEATVYGLEELVLMGLVDILAE